MTNEDNFAWKIMNHSILNKYSGMSWFSHLKHNLNHISISYFYFFFLFFKLIYLFIFQMLSPLGSPFQSSSLHTPSSLLLRRCSPNLHPQTTPHWAIPFSWTLSLYRIRCILSYWDQQGSLLPHMTLGAMDKPMYLLWWLSLWELLGGPG